MTLYSVGKLLQDKRYSVLELKILILNWYI